MAQHKHTNRLINETSPHLLQHAHNPVDWFPWGDEAIEEAKRLDLPILLSIGYSSCHWCHKMEQEVFSDEATAALLNSTFINIKVDREELPDVDYLYMEFAQSMLAGSIGWPLHLVLTPDLYPFYAATYIPALTQDGLLGMKELAVQMKHIWQSGEKERVISQAENIVEVLSDHEGFIGEDLPADEVINEGAELLFKLADPIFGGLTGSPKFPIGYQSTFLLRYSLKTKDGRALYYITKALKMMYQGGIYDHLGGGFCRYSLDEMWLVPHFEKMLFDNAIQPFAYLELWQVTRDPFYRNICEDCLNYILRELTMSEGGFFGSQDSDSEKKEGYYYTWTPREIEDVLGFSNGSLFCEFYGVTEMGHIGTRSVLHIQESLKEFCQERSLDVAETQHTLELCKKELFAARTKKTPPPVDDKTLTSWNALAIHTFAIAGRAFDEEKYLTAAVRAATFIRENLWKQGRLLRCWRRGEAKLDAIFHEYAYLIRACLTLHETTGSASWLAWAIQLTDDVEKKFKAPQSAFYQTPEGAPNIILRRFRFTDGAEPSGNGVHAENLLRLAQMTGESYYGEQAEDIFMAIAPQMEAYPSGYYYHLIAYQWYLNKTTVNIVIALNSKRDFKEEIARLIHHNLPKHLTIVWLDPDEPLMLTLIPAAADFRPIDGQTTLYKIVNSQVTDTVNNLADIIKLINLL